MWMMLELFAVSQSFKTTKMIFHLLFENFENDIDSYQTQSSTQNMIVSVFCVLDTQNIFHLFRGVMICQQKMCINIG